VTDPRRLVVLALLLAGCGARAAGPPSSIAKVALPAAKPESRAPFEEGLRLLQLGPKSYNDARTAFAKAVEVDPKLYEAWHDLGIVEARLGRWDAAVEAFGRALDVQPGSRPTALALGNAFERAGRPGDAAALYHKRAAAAPDDTEVRLLYVQALRESGETSKALEEAQALLAKGSRNAAAWNALGLVYLKLEKYPLAESALRHASEIEPKNAAVWNNIGLVALAAGRDQEAFTAFEKAADLDPKSVEARLNKAAVFLDCGDYKRALSELDRADKAHPNDPEVLVALGVAHRGQKHLDAAREAYERALEIQPDFPAALYNLGVLYMDFAPDKKKARESFQLYRKVAPSNDPKLADARERLKELK
jgi:tetratricopeptide (TPR) repeat protein